MSVSPTEYFDSGLKTCECVSFCCQKNEVRYSPNIFFKKLIYLFIIYNLLFIIYLYYIKLVIYIIQKAGFL